jgi:AraC-like DNA-binding protein
MELLTCHLAHLERKYPSKFQISNIGSCLKTNQNFIYENPFNTINFSFILEGSGTYRDETGIYAIQAPYLITQCDQFSYSYGPGEGEKWKEVYFMYPLFTRDVFVDSGLYKSGRKHWPIQNETAVEKNFEQLSLLLKDRNSEGVIDLIDRICENSILESIRTSTKSENKPYFSELEKLKDKIDKNLDQPNNFQELAKEHNISYSAFRKYWKNYFGKSPQNYLNDKKIQEARRLLVETNLSISEIAYQLNFEDRLYFSKRFKRQTNQSATSYRKTHETRHNLL